MFERIYLDHAATTPLRAEAREAMEPYLAEAYGNPSSLHQDGQRAKRALDTARDIVAGALNSKFSDITFTSGGTEADNAAIAGVMLANRSQGDHLIVSAIEHEAVLRTANFLATLGFRVGFVEPDDQGLVDPATVAVLIEPRTVLISVMHGNNEVGTIQPIREIARLAHSRGILLHTDAVQTFGQLPVDVRDLEVDLLTVSSHKIYGPKGIGGLFARSDVPIEPWLHGGAQERERRAGTENVAGIVGFGEAVRLMESERESRAERLRVLRDRFTQLLLTRMPGTVLNGHPLQRLPNNVNVSFVGVSAESLLVALDLAGISASSGSACSSGSIEPSHVLTAMGLPMERVMSAIRFSLGRGTTWEELKRTADVVDRIVSAAAVSK